MISKITYVVIFAALLMIFIGNITLFKIIKGNKLLKLYRLIKGIVLITIGFIVSCLIGYMYLGYFWLYSIKMSIMSIVVAILYYVLCGENAPIRIFYLKKRKDWYMKTYNSLGSEWLYKTLTNKDLHLKPNFSLRSTSANIGLYEQQTYKKLIKTGYQPKFVVSDLLGDELDNTPTSEGGFTYIKESINANSISEKDVDVVLDIKGALWYCIRNEECTSRKERLIDLLNAYKQCLKDDDSVLIFDGYKTHKIKYCVALISNSIPLLKKNKLNYFLECSTLDKLLKLFRLINFNDYHILPDDEEKMWTNEKDKLLKYMYVCYLKKEELSVLIEKIEKIDEKKIEKL